jgi:hypothetical protein
MPEDRYNSQNQDVQNQIPIILTGTNLRRGIRAYSTNPRNSQLSAYRHGRGNNRWH